ncbi:GNAT family N-acetyltransferase [Bacillus sp. 31A1R]|uniref:GNAT family N-acetyltransferase n=1 Tax=Robertmurraya mangrovi TaxID=3098077 RepID=A0ABU5IWM3_9BACI|nr:GNAT family N-acetyltransferase [Bacillus sp. 31A1R]MDZ5471532.1 GNAT family N-acetyltransferase [Bacillus sp. 31A1R]
MKIRLASASDLEWINEQYKKADFLLSDLQNEYVVIATIDNERAGVGRLVKINEDTAEMGGIYTLEEFRGKKVADSIVKHLVEQAQQIKYFNIYCIPFKPLKNFYAKHGFSEITQFEHIHPDILNKLNFCKKEYETDVLLMKI